MKALSEIPGPVIQWLLKQEPWTIWRCRQDLMNEDKKSKEVNAEFNRLIKHPLIRTILNEITYWPGPVLKRHNDASLLLHKLTFLADLGLDNQIDEIKYVCEERILPNVSSEGPFTQIINIPVVFGGSGKDESEWLLCDAPLISYCLLRFGYGNDFRVQKSIKLLVSLISEQGWPCAASETIGKKFKGPGKRTDPCPYANLIMLKLLAKSGTYSQEAERGINVLLNLWEKRRERKPFLFAMGTDFCKLKAPFIWYDILHVTDVLSRFKTMDGNQTFSEMIDILAHKADESPLLKAESVWKAWKDFDFGQKKEASGWITFLTYRILAKANRML